MALEGLLFRARALAQTHPFTPRAQGYLNHTVAREAHSQPLGDVSIWVSSAITVGYCLRKIEEDDTASNNGVSELKVNSSSKDLEEISSELAGRIQSETAGDFLLWPEPKIVDLLDELIAGEVDRRLSGLVESQDRQTLEGFEQYIAWWVIKGYCLRVAEQVLTVSSD